MTQGPSRLRLLFGPAYWVVALGLLVVGLLMVVWYTPIATEPGAVRKIFYFHLPVAMVMFFACFVVFAASALFLWHRAAWCDDLAHAAAEVVVLFCSVVLLTGMIWAQEVWGHWWDWSPRLTLSLVLWLLYVAYLVVRSVMRSPERRSIVCAVFGIIAFLDVPLVYYSVRLMPGDAHAASQELSLPVLWTTLYWMLPVGLLCVGFIRVRYELLQRKRSLDEVARVAHNEHAKALRVSMGGSP